MSVNSVAYIKCPEKCSQSSAGIFGDEIYSEDSSICLAAIHYGMISDKGGEFKIMILGA